jgi:hypothetical protein
MRVSTSPASRASIEASTATARSRGASNDASATSSGTSKRGGRSGSAHATASAPKRRSKSGLEVIIGAARGGVKEM